MDLKFKTYFLEFKTPFGISKITRKGTETVLIELHQNGVFGYGEAVLPPYLKENSNNVIRLLKSTKIPDFKHFSLNEIDNILNQLLNNPDDSPAYTAAIDMALHDLLSKTKKQSLADLYQIKSQHSPLSSFTIGFSTTKEIKVKLQDAKPFNLIKLKLGGPRDFETINEVTQKTSLPIAADLNQAWEFVDEKLLDLLEQSNCQYLEEPFKTNDLLQDLKTELPIIADESFQGYKSFEYLPKEFNGINIKLMKCGGLREAFKIIKEAKKRRLKIILGCMSGSSCAIAAMSQFSSMADWIDLDGPALISNDFFRGLNYKSGKIVLKNNFGIGVDTKNNLD